jgi:hypothetical protein
MGIGGTKKRESTPRQRKSLKFLIKDVEKRQKNREKRVAKYPFLWKKFDSDNLCLQQPQVVILDDEEISQKSMFTVLSWAICSRPLLVLFNFHRHVISHAACVTFSISPFRIVKIPFFVKGVIRMIIFVYKMVLAKADTSPLKSMKSKPDS